MSRVQPPHPRSLLGTVDFSPMADTYEKRLNREVVCKRLVAGIIRGESSDILARDFLRMLPKNLRTSTHLADLKEFVHQTVQQLQREIFPDLSLAGQPAAALADGKSRDMSLPALLYLCPKLPIDKAVEYLPYLNEAMARAGINTRARQAAFLSQLLLESNQFINLEEIPSRHSGPNFGKYDGKIKLGNIQAGDGARFKGRGFIQLTGRYNYTKAGAALGLDLVNHPELAADPRSAVNIAAWYWNEHDMNPLADRGQFREVVSRINGRKALNYDDRLYYYQQALAILSH